MLVCLNNFLRNCSICITQLKDRVTKFFLHLITLNEIVLIHSNKTFKVSFNRAKLFFFWKF